MNATSFASGVLEGYANATHLNDSSSLDCDDEPHQYATWSRVSIVIVAVFLSMATVVGNVMVMISITIDKQLQTISNYFLFSLAVADFAIGLFSMPLFTVYTVLGYWPLGPFICDTWLALDYLASNASVLNLLIISFDRYFSVTRPLTYRAKRTPSRAGLMIGSAWGISLLLWPPWIYAWPHIEGKRTVPQNACYIQFIETNHYITFGTAIAAFYVPVSVMIILYWQIWKETKKRQKELPKLQGDKQETSKRSNSSDEALDADGKRPRSESSTAAEDVNASSIVSYIDRHYPQYRTKHRPFSWSWLKMWCVAWWHSGREDEDEEEEIEGAESSRAGPTYEETTTPLSVETPLTGPVSRCDSITGIHSTGLGLDRTVAPIDNHEYKRPVRPADVPTKSISSDFVYTILIKLPRPEGNGTGKYSEGPSIRMYHDEAVTLQLHSMIQTSDDESTRILRLGGTLASPSSVIRRPSQMPDIRIPLNATNMPRAIAGKAILSKPVNKKKQEKKSERKAAKTLSAILLAFIITWTPYNILVLLKSIIECLPKQLWDFFYYLCYINSTVNPVCYALCNTAFRRTYVRILKCKWNSRNRTAVNRG